MRTRFGQDVRLSFPLSENESNFPRFLSSHGKFGAVRTHDVHTGIDLYTKEGAYVRAIEAGLVVAIEDFTGLSAGSPWWLDTQAVLVESPAGVWVYGEVKPEVAVGQVIASGDHLGHVLPVLRPEEVRADIPGHSRFMLHLELHKAGTRETSWWRKGDPQPPSLLDPTPLLFRAWNELAIKKAFEQEGKG